MNRCFFLICLCFLSLSFCSVAYPYVFEVYDSSDGLASGWINQIYQDTKGDLWITTHKSISRYDGKKFHNFKMKKDWKIRPFYPGISSVAEDDKGNLWFGIAQGGIVKYNDEI